MVVWNSLLSEEGVKLPVPSEEESLALQEILLAGGISWSEGLTSPVIGRSGYWQITKGLLRSTKSFKVFKEWASREIPGSELAQAKPPSGAAKPRVEGAVTEFLLWFQLKGETKDAIKEALDDYYSDTIDAEEVYRRISVAVSSDAKKKAEASGSLLAKH